MEGEHSLIWIDKEPPYYKGQHLDVHYILPHKCGTVWLEIEFENNGSQFYYIADCYTHISQESFDDGMMGYSCKAQGVKEGTFGLIAEPQYKAFRVCFVGNITANSTSEIQEHYDDNVRPGSARIVAVLELAIEDGATYIEQTSVSVTHQITSTVAYADTLQWQELISGAWGNIEGETDEILTIGTWTGDPADDEETARANTNSIIPAYDRRFCCVATNEVGETKTKIMHVVHEAGNGTPTVTEEEW